MSKKEKKRNREKETETQSVRDRSKMPALKAGKDESGRESENIVVGKHSWVQDRNSINSILNNFVITTFKYKNVKKYF